MWNYPNFTIVRHPGGVSQQTALLINPFYPKDPQASFGKHVLTPAPPRFPKWWESAHLTFCKRAYALAKWYRDRGAKVIFGGRHVMSCPDEVRPHCDAMALG